MSIDGKIPASTVETDLAKWETKDAQIMTWILSSVEPHFILNLWPYNTAKDMWDYLKKVDHQANAARRFQLKYTFTQGSLSIEEYYSSFQNLWVEYSNIIYVGISGEALLAVQTVHETSKRDQFSMKQRYDFDATRSNPMNRDSMPMLDACLSELLREEQRIKTHTVMEQNMNSTAPVSVAYAAQGKNKPRDMRSVQCYSCKGFGHLVKDCSQKFCNYCKQREHIISACPIRPAKK